MRPKQSATGLYRPLSLIAKAQELPILYADFARWCLHAKQTRVDFYRHSKKSMILDCILHLKLPAKFHFSRPLAARGRHYHLFVIGITARMPRIRDVDMSILESHCHSCMIIHYAYASLRYTYLLLQSWFSFEMFTVVFDFYWLQPRGYFIGPWWLRRGRSRFFVGRCRETYRGSLRCLSAFIYWAARWEIGRTVCTRQLAYKDDITIVRRLPFQEERGGLRYWSWKAKMIFNDDIFISLSHTSSRRKALPQYRATDSVASLYI